MLEPAYSRWSALLEANRSESGGWPARLLEERASARGELLEAARAYSASIGFDVPEVVGEAIVVTGHQPDLYHPGIWAKDFLLERLTREVSGTGLDLVVDTDVVGSVGFSVPGSGAVVRRRDVLLRGAATGSTWLQAPPPSATELAAFRAAGRDAVDALGVPALIGRFDVYCACLEEAARGGGDLATILTAARRCIEAPLGMGYLQLPVSSLARTRAFRRFAAELLLDAGRFREAMNAALAEYRRATHTRSAAQPFPDLHEDATGVEVPFWLLDETGRHAVSVDDSGRVSARGRELMRLAATPGEVAEDVADRGLLLAPRALSLTLFTRLFLADLFIHGLGGGRYDRITDAVMRAYYGVEPPGYCVASLALLLPLGVPATTDADVAEAERRLKRFEHNPDELLAASDDLAPPERERLQALAARKHRLIAELGRPGADRKTLGLEVRAVNAELAIGLAPVGEALRAEAQRVRIARDAWDVLGARDYPFFLWDPADMWVRANDVG